MSTDPSTTVVPANLCVLVIPDGHRRYARQNHVSYEAACSLGAKVAQSLVQRASCDPRIRHLALYPLAQKNLVERSAGQLESIFLALHDFLRSLLPLATETMDICHRGSLAGLPADIVAALKALAPESSVSHNANHLPPGHMSDGRLTLELLVNYSGESELLRLTKNQVVSHLSHPYHIVLRTGGNFRLSDAPPLQCHPADLVAAPELFPTFSYSSLDVAINNYYSDLSRRLVDSHAFL